MAPRRGEPGIRDRLGRFTTPFSLTGHPSVTLPASVPGPLPVGIQVVTRRGTDAQTIAIAAALERTWRLGPQRGPTGGGHRLGPSAPADAAR